RHINTCRCRSTASTTSARPRNSPGCTVGCRTPTSSARWTPGTPDGARSLPAQAPSLYVIRASTPSEALENTGAGTTILDHHDGHDIHHGGPPMTFRLSRMFDLVEHWAAAEPDREALIFGEQSWSWAKLDTRVRKAAAALQAAGVSAGDRFAVLDKNHPVCLELTLAASVIGAVNVVVNFRLAEEELVYVLGDSAAKLVIVGAEFAETLDRLRDRLPTIQQTVVLGGEKDE